jgi:glutathione S-transferase
MSEIVVYGIPGSPFVRSVQLGLEEKNVPYRFEALRPGTLRDEDHLKRHAFGRIPVIEHGDFRLYETQAILRYLDAAFPNPELQPREPRAVGRMNQIVGINDWYFFPKVAAAIVFNRIVGPVLMGIAPNEAAIADAMPVARTCIAELSRLLGEQRFMAGNDLSLADLMLAPQVDFLNATPEGRDLLRGTVLEAWLGRMNERPSMRRTQRPENLRTAVRGDGG